MVAFAQHEHVRILHVCSDTVDNEVLEEFLICEPGKIFKQRTCKVNPHTTIGLYKSNSEDIRFFLNRIPIPPPYDIFKPLIIWNKLSSILSIDDINSPVGLFGSQH